MVERRYACIHIRTYTHTSIHPSIHTQKCSIKKYDAKEVAALLSEGKIDLKKTDVCTHVYMYVLTRIHPYIHTQKCSIKKYDAKEVAALLSEGKIDLKKPFIVVGGVTALDDMK
jgi:hypothetical protein